MYYLESGEWTVSPVFDQGNFSLYSVSDMHFIYVF